MKPVNFKKSFVVSGKKAVNEAAAQLTLTSSYGGFKLNGRAMSELGVDVGEYVAMFDQFDSNAPVTQDERYFICAANYTDENDNQAGSILGQTRGFSYSYIYGTMLLGDANVQSVGKDGLISAGKMVKTESNSYVSTEITTYDLVPYADGDLVEIAEGVERKVFMLVNPVTKKHDPRSASEESIEVDLD